MVDQLTPSNRPPQSLEAISNPQRLEALLASGQPRTAQVVQVSPQLPATPNSATPNSAALNSAPSNPATTTLTPSLTTGTNSAPPSLITTTATTTTITTATLITTPTSPAAPSTTTSTISIQAATTANPTPPPTTQAEVYKIQIRLEGRLYELLTSKPLDLGSRIQLSSDGDKRVSILQLPATTPASSTPAAKHATATATATTTTTTTTTTTAAATTATEPPRPLISNPAGSHTRSETQPAPPSQLSRSAPTGNIAVERLAMQPLMPELASRIGPGERLNANVISSRLNPTPANMQQPNTLAAAPVTTATHNSTLSTATIKTDLATAAIKIGQGSYQVRIDLQQGQKLEFTSPRPLPPGMQVQLLRDTQGQLWMELPSPQTRAIEQALREHLPQQQPPSALFNLLSSNQATGQLQQAKPLLLSLFQILLGRPLTSPLQTDAASVKQQVQNSGTLLESKLAQSSTNSGIHNNTQSNTQNINLDHKAILLKVTQHLSQGGNQKELPAALSERINLLTQQALSRVLINQITSLGAQTQDAGNEQSRTLALDIPIAWQDRTENLQLKIQRDERGQDEATGAMQYRWQVRLSFEVDENRTLEAELTLESDQISIIWSGDTELRRRLEMQLDQLQQRLESVGLKVKTLGVREQLPETDHTPKPPRNQLIDIKT